MNQKAILFAFVFSMLVVVAAFGIHPVPTKAVTISVWGCNDSSISPMDASAQKAPVSNTTANMTKEQKDIVQFGRYVDYMAANYGGEHNDSAFLTVEQSHAFSEHLSETYGIPMHFFTDGTYRDTIFANGTVVEN